MVVRFGDFTLDRERYELRRAGESIEVEPQVLEVLGHLIEHRDRVVTKEELLEQIWEGRFVSDAAISRAIRQTRRALGDTATQSRWIKTIYGRGFSFVGAVESDRTMEVARASAELHPAPLPEPLTPLVGREAELARAGELLADCRLLTLTGAAGTGKSRLALALANRVRGQFPDGVAWVPLAEVEDGDLLLGAIALALGVSDAAGSSTVESLRLHLQANRLLLILDNFEQILESAHWVSTLLEGCPDLTAIVTSRFVLRVNGEQEYSVPPLELPDRTAGSTHLALTPAVELFLARARAVRPDFDPSDEELHYIAEICRRLDGLPLAIELAAARIKLFSAQTLWERLAGRFDLLSSPTRRSGQPFQTLDRALAWSYDLLDEAEQQLLRRVAVFARGFDLDAVVEVCEVDGDDAIEIVASLVDKSLIERQPRLDGGIRFGLLETTRQFALARLEEEGVAEELRNAHSQWTCELACRGREALVGGNQQQWLGRLDSEYGNLRSALEWSRSGGDLEVGLRTGAALGRFWSARGIYREGQMELALLLADPRAAGVDPTVRAEALVAYALLTHLLCDYRRAAASLDEAKVLLIELDDRPRLAETLNHLSWVALQVEVLAEAEGLCRQALDLNEELDDSRGIAVSLNNLAWLELYRGETAKAEELFARSLERRRQVQDARGIVFALTNLAMVRLLAEGADDDVEGWLSEARQQVEHLADRPLEGWLGCQDARRQLSQGDFDTALKSTSSNRFMLTDLGHRDGAAWVELTRGEIFVALGDRPAARGCFEAALEIWEELESHWGMAQSLQRLAGLAALDGDTEQASLFSSRVAEISQRFGVEVVESGSE